MPATGGRPTPAKRPRPVVRSSNLSVTRAFTDRDRDEFAHSTYEYIANLFEVSIPELERRNPGIEGTFRRADANHFAAVLYREGKAVARCRIWLGSMMGGGGTNIFYSANDRSIEQKLNIPKSLLTVRYDQKTARHFAGAGRGRVSEPEHALPPGRAIVGGTVRCQRHGRK